MSTQTLPQAPGVYIILNVVNQHMYVGSTSDLDRRYKHHLWDLRKGKHHSNYLQRAYNKYGSEAFAFVVVDHLSDTSKLIEREQLFIDLIKPEYNVLPFAGRSDGLPPNILAARGAKISSVLTGQKRGKQSPEHVANRMASTKATKETILAKNPDAYKHDSDPEQMAKAIEAARVANTGRKLSEERKSKMSESHKRKKHSDETKAKISAAMLGKKPSSESIAKQKATKAEKRLENPDAYKPTEETRAKMSAVRVGRKMSPESIAKSVVGSKATRESKKLENPGAYKKTPEQMAKATEAARIVNTSRKQSPEHTAKIVASKKAKREAKLVEQQKLQPPLF